MKKTPSADELQSEAQEFQASRQTVMLATADQAGMPHVSYAPFALDDEGGMCILVSELAQHTRDLLMTGKVHAMLIADEQDARNLFARKRLLLECDVEEIGRKATAWPELLQSLAQRFGNTIGLLEQLPDFHLFRLLPTQGSYVRGFGQAYQVSGSHLKIGDKQTKG